MKGLDEGGGRERDLTFLLEEKYLRIISKTINKIFNSK